MPDAAVDIFSKFYCVWTMWWLDAGTYPYVIICCERAVWLLPLCNEVWVAFLCEALGRVASHDSSWVKGGSGFCCFVWSWNVSCFYIGHQRQESNGKILSNLCGNSYFISHFAFFSSSKFISTEYLKIFPTVVGGLHVFAAYVMWLNQGIRCLLGSTLRAIAFALGCSWWP